LASACGSSDNFFGEPQYQSHGDTIGGTAERAPEAEAPAAEPWFDDVAVSMDMAQELSGDHMSVSAAGEQRPEIIIKSGFVELITENFDSDKTHLETLTRQMGGFIESSDIFNEGSYRRYHVVLRVPKEHFSELKEEVEKTGRLISTSENIQNVTGEYYDTQGRLEIKRIEEERILEMIENAENVETILILEEQLGRVRTDIELMQSWINNIDSLANFSTLTVNMAEVQNIRLFADTGNFGQRLWHNLRSSASNTSAFFGTILVFLAGAVIPLVLIIFLVFTGFLARKKLHVWRKKEGMN
jgi:hypothetical protein